MSYENQIWSGNKKIIARQETIIDQYRNLYQRNSLPEDREYWAMCGLLTDQNGLENKLNEYVQLNDQGLIKPKQFFGVELQEEIYKKNINCYPNLNIFHGDFFKVLNKHANESKLNPAIVNMDTIKMPKSAAEEFSKVLALLSNLPGETMLVVNICLKCRHLINDENNFLTHLKNNHLFNAFKHHWNFDNKCYKYAGNSEHKKTEMGSYIFFK